MQCLECKHWCERCVEHAVGFISNIKPGDILIVPHYGKTSVCRRASDCFTCSMTANAIWLIAFAILAHPAGGGAERESRAKQLSPKRNHANKQGTKKKKRGRDYFHQGSAHSKVDDLIFACAWFV